MKLLIFPKDSKFQDRILLEGDNSKWIKRWDSPWFNRTTRMTLTKAIAKMQTDYVPNSRSKGNLINPFLLEVEPRNHSLRVTRDHLHKQLGRPRTSKMDLRGFEMRLKIYYTRPIQESNLNKLRQAMK